jgi:hypothetical protein
MVALFVPQKRVARFAKNAENFPMMNKKFP